MLIFSRKQIQNWGKNTMKIKKSKKKHNKYENNGWCMKEVGINNDEKKIEL